VTSSGSDYNPHRYGGKVGYYSEGPLGLILAGQRWYSPQLMRWMSRDPIEYDGGENLYAYVGQRPTGYLDPNGLDQVINSTGHSIIVTGNAGAGHGSGAQIFGTVPADGATHGGAHGGAHNPVPGYSTPATPIVFLGPLILPLPPVGQVQDIDFYQCDITGLHKLYGDEEGPVTEIGINQRGEIGILSRAKVYQSIYRYFLRRFQD
jgi:RHS repeat-associated protein